MAQFGNFGGPALSGAGISSGFVGAPYGGSVGGYGSAVPYGGNAGFQAQPAVGVPYGGLAGYGAPRAAGFYNPASYSTSLSGDALAYGAPAFAAARPAAQYSGPVLSGLPAASSYGGVSGGIEQYGANLAPQIEAAYEAAALHRRQPVVRRQVIQVPGNPGQVRQIVRRVPTPIPDVIERVFVVKPQRDVVNLVIERPTTPPPQIKNRTVVARPRRPVIHSHVVRVPPRSGLQVQQQQVPQIQYQQAAPQYQAAPVVQQPQYVQAAPVAQPQYVQAAPVAAPAGYAYEPYGNGYSYSSSFDTVYGGGAPAAYNAVGYQPVYGGYSTGFQANYGLPSYGGAVSYAQPAYNYGYAQPAAYGAAYPQYPALSGAYSGAYAAQPVAGAAYPSIIAANPAGAAYYGAGYPGVANYGGYRF